MVLNMFVLVEIVKMEIYIRPSNICIGCKIVFCSMQTKFWHIQYSRQSFIWFDTSYSE